MKGVTMKIRIALVIAIAAVTTTAVVVASAGSKSRNHHPKSVDAVVEEHLDALHDCDAERLVAGYTQDAKLFFPDGVVVEGRSELRDVYEDFVRPFEEGGLCGLTATPVESARKGKTIFIKFEVEAPFLAEPYFSTDAYIIRAGLIWSEVSTFDATKLVFN
jgi:hypothetical protein